MSSAERCERTESMVVYELRRAETAEDLAAMHRLRRDVLFARRGRAALYNDAHPDDAVANHLKFLLVLDGERIGTARLDLVQGVAKLRLVVIAAERQRQGHGAVMEQLIAGHAHRLGVTTLLVNSAPDAVGFYEKCGWQQELWDASELVGSASDCVQMAKYL